MKGPLLEIVGVADNVPQMGLDIQPQSQMYFPVAQHASGAMKVMNRTHGDPESMMPSVRHTLASIDSNIAIQSLKTSDE